MSKQREKKYYKTIEEYETDEEYEKTVRIGNEDEYKINNSTVKYITVKKNLLWNRSNEYQELIDASKHGHLKLVEFLVENNVPIFMDNYMFCDYCPLITASIYNNANIVGYFLENGADVNKLEEVHEGDYDYCENWSALNYAVYNNSKGVVKVLLEYNADVNTDEYGKTSLLQYASKYNYILIVEKLLQINTLWDFIETAEELYHNYFSYAYENATEENNIEIVNLLKNFAIEQFPIDLPGDVIINIIVNYIGNDHH